MWILALLVVVCLAVGAAPAAADTTTAGGLRLVSLGTFDAPVDVAAPTGDANRLFIVERGDDDSPSRIVLLRDGVRQPASFLDITALVRADGAERGLLSMAFSPDYAASGRFYVYYTRRDDPSTTADENGAIQIDEFRRSASDPDRADPATRRPILTEPHPGAGNHNGGQLAFGPDGMLYAGPGDGGDADDSFQNAQNLGTLRGKLIRIDPRGGSPYAIPPDNPFVGRPGVRGEIYAFGLRNPFRFSFDRLTGDLAIGDVGQGAWEEIDFAASGQARGVNYGWSVFEGMHTNLPGADDVLDPSGPYVAPVIERSHDDGYCAITGGYVVRDASVAQLAGRYLFSDFCTGSLETAVLAPGSATQQAPTGLVVSQVSSFGEDGRCRIHVASVAGGVYRLETVGAPAAAPACPGASGPAPAPPPVPKSMPPPVDRTRPVVRGLRLTRTRFAVGRRATVLSARAAVRRRAAVPRGTQLTFTLSEAATVTIRIQRLLAGRRAGSACVATSARTLRAPRCTRPITTSRLIRRRAAGRALVPFTGRVGGRALLPGRYRAMTLARDAAGNRGVERGLPFTIVAG